MNCVEVEGMKSSLDVEAGGASLSAAFLPNVSPTIILDRRVHTNSFPRGVVAARRLALFGGVFDVVGDGVREAPGNNALYMSFLRGFAALIRSAAVGVSDGFVVKGRDGGGIVFDA
jgi:hypothetical protein